MEQILEMWVAQAPLITALATLLLVVVTLGYMITAIISNRFFRSQTKLIGQQTEELQRSRRLASLPALFEIIKSDTWEGRENIYQEYFKNPDKLKSREHMPKELQKECQRILLDLNAVSILIRAGLLDKSIVDDWLHVIPLKMWIILGDYAESEASRRNLQSHSLATKYLTLLSLEYWFSSPEGKRDSDFIIFHNDPTKEVEHIPSWKLRKLQEKISGDLKEHRWIPENSNSPRENPKGYNELGIQKKEEKERSWVPWKWSPDRWISFTALLVAVCALIITYYSVSEERRHNRLSVRPNLNITFHVSEKGAGWIFENNGVGPALIQGVKITVDDKPQVTWRAVSNAIGFSPTADFEYINLRKGGVVAEGISNPLFRVFTRPEFEQLVQNWQVPHKLE